MNFPFVISDIDPRMDIDLDKTNGSVDGANRSCGTYVIGNRYQEVGPYSKSEKLLFLWTFQASQ